MFIMTDQQSADVMSCRMGDQYIHTPAMDSLAKTGTVFTRAYAPNPLCMPARASIFTGRYPHTTRVTKNARPPSGRLDPEFVCMGTYLRNAGYAAAYSGKWHLCFDRKNADTHGFEILNSKQKLAPPQDDNYDSRISHAAVRYLQREHEVPFLLVVSYLNPHNICEWARRAAGRNQRLSCGEIGVPPASGQLPPAPVNLAVPKNEPDGVIFIRRAYQAGVPGIAEQHVANGGRGRHQTDHGRPDGPNRSVQVLPLRAWQPARSSVRYAGRFAGDREPGGRSGVSAGAPRASSQTGGLCRDPSR